MRILTFDTTADKMFITIGNDGNVDTSEIIETTKERYHSALLIPTIIKLLKKYNLTMQDIDAIGTNVGPGSFTGIRASSTVARVISQNLNIPAIGIPSLEIISQANNTDKPVLIIFDARKEKVYTGIYGKDGEIISKPQALDIDKAIELAKSKTYSIITDKRLAETLKKEDISYIVYEELNYDFGKALAKLTYKYAKEENGEKYKWYNLKPLYIQPPPISMPKQQTT